MEYLEVKFDRDNYDFGTILTTTLALNVVFLAAEMFAVCSVMLTWSLNLPLVAIALLDKFFTDEFSLPGTDVADEIEKFRVGKIFAMGCG